MTTFSRTIGGSFGAFTVTQEGDVCHLSFEKARPADIFARWQFNSEILHSFVLDSDNPPFWIRGDRLSCYILGFPPNIHFTRSRNKHRQFSVNATPTDLEGYADTLASSLSSILIRHEFSNYECIGFNIVQEDESILEYHFAGGAREVTGFMILYSEGQFWRDQMEFHLHVEDWPEVKIWGWPDNIPAGGGKVYGDPSKATQAAEQSGWGGRYDEDEPAFATGMGIFNERRQSWYQITTRVQDIEAMRARSPIPYDWRVALHEQDNYTCLYCGRQGDSEDWNGTGTHNTLDPDHRIPVNIQSDELTEENYLDILMTLCKPCNQRKREESKRLNREGFDDWDNWEWAYPDRVDFVVMRILGNLHVIGDMTEVSEEEWAIETIDAARRLIERLLNLLPRNN